MIKDDQLTNLTSFQGWAAVVANLEDTAILLQRRNEKFDSVFRAYLGQREKQKEVIDAFDDDIALLHQVQPASSIIGNYYLLCLPIKVLVFS